MIVLNTVNQSIEILMAEAATTTNPSFVSTYADNDGTLFTEGEKDGALNGTTAVAVVDAPAVSARRIIKEINVYNEDTVPVVITVRLNNNGIYRNLVKETLAVAGEWKWTSGAINGVAISDIPYDISWGGITNIAPSKKAVYNKINSMPQSFSSVAEALAGVEAAKASAPDVLKATRAVDAAFWGIKNLRLIQAKVGDATRVQVNPDNMNIALNIGDHYHVMTAAVDVDEVDNLDTGALAAGTDYYVYACTDGTTLSFLVSANSTNPTGFDAAHSRKIGGFHTLCVAVGAIGGHTLTGYAVKDILPASVWCLKHRVKNLVNVGMVYDDNSKVWVQIYLASGTGSSMTSVNGGTISDTRNKMDFIDDGLAKGMRLLRSHEFVSAAAGSNEETNITGSADPATTSGHSDTAGRRMISNIGCEDCCGVVWQWLFEDGYYYYGATGYWGNLPGAKGSVYTQFAADPGASEVDNSDSGGDIGLLAGGSWAAAASCGSRSRAASNARWGAYAAFGARFVSEPL